MRWLAWTVLAFAVAVGLALLMRFNHGNVIVFWPPYRLEVSINLALALVLIAFIGGHAFWVGATRALGLPARVRDYRERRQLVQAIAALRDAVFSYFEGRPARAERHAQVAQRHPATSSAAALVAARAAHRMQETARRDRWLQQADEDALAAGAILMTRAELAVEDRRAQEAIGLIEQVHAGGVRHVVSLRTALRAYEQAERWDDVLKTLRRLEKRDALHPAAVERLRERAFRGVMERASGDMAQIRALWKALKPDEQRRPALVRIAASALAEAGGPAEAGQWLEQAIDQSFDPDLVVLYARIAQGALRERLQRLEAWRTRHGDLPALLAALGRVCADEKLWGKAEEYLKEAAALEPSPAAFGTLGQLYEQLDRSAEAAEAYRTAARLAVQARLVVPSRDAARLS